MANSVNIVPLKGIYLQINNNIETMVGVLQALWFFSVFYNKEDCSCPLGSKQVSTEGILNSYLHIINRLQWAAAILNKMQFTC